MRKLCLFVLFAVMFGMTSCMDTYYMTKKTTLDNAVSSIRTQLADQGFDLNGTNTNNRNETVVTDVSYSSTSGYGTAMANNLITQDTYRFADSNGNTMNYSVSYSAKQTNDGVPYVEDLELCGCETSNPKDYEKFCGDRAVVKQINNLPKDQQVKRLNVIRTTLVGTGVALALSIIGVLLFGNN